jgi:hypothetical protein
MPTGKRAIGSDLRKVDAHVIRSHEYEEAPELTDEQLANAAVSGGRQAARSPAFGTAAAGERGQSNSTPA